jgi:hypothetical protein
MIALYAFLGELSATIGDVSLRFKNDEILGEEVEEDFFVLRKEPGTESAFFVIICEVIGSLIPSASRRCLNDFDERVLLFTALTLCGDCLGGSKS